MKKKIIYIILIVIVLLRFLLSYHLKSFFIINLTYDDKLMIYKLMDLNKGLYLGNYTPLTLIKGIIYPLCLFISYHLHLTYSSFFTILYILACSYFAYSLKSIIKNKYIIIGIYFILLFNPISYSSELFQRLYRNSLAPTELLLYLGLFIRIIADKKNYVHRYILLGIMIFIMIMTKEENIWIVFSMLVLFIYKVHQSHDPIHLSMYLLPVFITILCLNVLCFINARHYGIYTYNELSKSEFKNTYIKILQIKDKEKIKRVSIPKSTLLKLAKESEVFNFSEKEIDIFSKGSSDYKGETSNATMMWSFRLFVHMKQKFKNGYEANEYYRKLGKDIDRLFKEGKLKKEFAFPSIFLNVPIKGDLKEIPSTVIKMIAYTSSYQDVKVLVDKDILKDQLYNKTVRAYNIEFIDRHNSANIQKVNPIGYEIIRIIYKWFTIIFSIISIGIFIANIKKKDLLNLILLIIILSYFIIIGGVSYTHVTAFNSIRYCYLGNVFILQSLFILFNIVRVIDNKKGNIIRNEE